MGPKQPTTSILTISLITILMLAAVSVLKWSEGRWQNTIVADAKGYYAYLPAIFIYHDLNFGFFDHIEKEKYYAENRYYDYRSEANGRVINKYYCGSAVVQLPFFAAAHLATHLTGADKDGYSRYYMIAITISAVFFLFLGLLYVNRLLALYRISEWNKSWILVATTFGTNLFYYSIVEPGLSHIYSFGFVAMFCFFGKHFFITKRPTDVLILGLILGMLVLIRPINGLIVCFLPFLAADIPTLRAGLAVLRNNKRLVFGTVIVSSLIISTQLVIYYFSTGSFWVYAYQKEGFNFLTPHFWDILFSYRKGLFLYTPMYLLACFVGGFALWQQSKFSFFAWFGFFTLLTYVLSSWWMWYYGGSFSGRVYVEYLPLFMILLGLGLQSSSSWWLRAALVLLMLFCQIQTHQYRHFQIHNSEMTKEKYWDTFLRVDRLLKK